MLFEKNSRVYFDFDYSDAEYGVYEADRKTAEYYKIGDFNTYIKIENLAIDKNAIVQSACEIHNNKMLSKKCTFVPISQFDPTSASSHDYKMILHIKRIDVGSGAVSVMSSGQTTTGGAIICGNIEIMQASSNSPLSILIVDRAQGVGSPYEYKRIQNVIEEIVANKLFCIKKL